MSNLTAKAAPEFLKDSVIYQINLRTFTPDGTLRAAERLLPHIAALGADMVYLCPVTLADDDPRPEFWSDRQKQSGLNNPKNIYRVGDYYAVDPEYGTFSLLHHSFELRYASSPVLLTNSPALQHVPLSLPAAHIP